MAGTLDEYKKLAAEKALEFIHPGMTVGLGHGTTVMHFVYALAEKFRQKTIYDILCIPCSGETEEESLRLGLPLATIESHPIIDCTVDGADEITAALDMIKGGGGALLREKILAQASTREIIVADESKLSSQLGSHRSVPIEVLPFGLRSQVRYFESIGGTPALRKTQEGSAFKTEQENYILDCDFGPISNPEELSGLLQMRAGIIAHGLFLGLATDALIAGREGVRHLKKDRAETNANRRSR